MALIDGVRDTFVNSLTNTNQHSKSKRTFSINTEVIKELLQEYLDEYLDLYVKSVDIEHIREYLAEYLFTDKPMETLLEEYGIGQSDFDKRYKRMHSGFKQLYEEEYS